MRIHNQCCRFRSQHARSSTGRHQPLCTPWSTKSDRPTVDRGQPALLRSPRQIVLLLIPLRAWSCQRAWLCQRTWSCQTCASPAWFSAEPAGCWLCARGWGSVIHWRRLINEGCLTSHLPCPGASHQVLVSAKVGDEAPKGLALFSTPMPTWLSHILSSVFLHQVRSDPQLSCDVHVRS